MSSSAAAGATDGMATAGMAATVISTATASKLAHRLNAHSLKRAPEREPSFFGAHDHSLLAIVRGIRGFVPRVFVAALRRAVAPNTPDCEANLAVVAHVPWCISSDEMS